jgi:hypothetical protein
MTFDEWQILRLPRENASKRQNLNCLDRDLSLAMSRKMGFATKTHWPANRQLLHVFALTLCGLIFYRHLWADCLENVGPSTSHNPMGLHGLLQG